ncbi:MAG: RIP metalloprotease RseP [Candidatus Kapaibacteriales bacterium]
MELLSNIVYFIIVIVILVVFHEFGHFITAKISKIRVDAFAIGMGPRLFGYNRVNGFSFGNLPRDFDLNGFCDYRICLFPFGGYVKIAGMIDESMDTSFINTTPKEYEFRSKGTLTKLLVISGGVIMNVILAILLFAIISYTEGKIIWQTTKIGFVQENSLAHEIGLIEGDEIIEINSTKINNWNDLIEKLSLDKFGSAKEIKLLRKSKEITLKIDGSKIVRAIAKENVSLGISPESLKIFIRDVETIAPAGKIGLRSGDTILAVNDNKINSFEKLTYILSQNKSKPVLLTWKRGNSVYSDSIVPTKEGKLGFYPGFHFCGKIDTISYSIFGALVQGINETWRTTNLFVVSITQIFKGTISAKESVGGPIMIAKGAAQQAKLGFIFFLNFIALLSISLAIINILPVPALDGGHFVLILIEGIIRKELPLKAKVIIQNIGIGILVALMAFVIINDVSKIIR